MFMFHIAVALGLMALAAGIFLYSWSSCQTGSNTCFAKLIGFIIILIASLSTICTLYCGFMLYQSGHLLHAGMKCMESGKIEATIADKNTAKEMVEKKKK